MRTSTLCIATVAASFAVSTSAATAAAPWSEPVELGPGTGVIDGQRLDFARAATPQFTYSFAAAPSENTGPAWRSAFARRRPDGTVIRDVLPEDVIAQARFGRRSWAVLRYRAPRGRGRALLRVSTGAGPGRLGEPRTLARYAVPDHSVESPTFGSSLPQIASDSRGNIAIIWIEAAGDGARIRLVHRFAGGRFSRAVTIASQPRRGTLRSARLT